LRGSITYDATDDQVEIGTNLIYARAHQYGYTPRNLPARPFLGINDQDANEIEAIFADYLESL
jgi:phage virion morphogenesis protein